MQHTADMVEFIRKHRLAVQSSVAAGGAPQAAVVGVAVTDALELVFDTVDTTRKCINLRRDPRLALVIGWDDACTLQLEGVADEPAGAELEALKQVYFQAFPDGPSRLSWPGLVYFRMRPSWARFSDYRVEPALITEFTGLALPG